MRTKATALVLAILVAAPAAAQRQAAPDTAARRALLNESRVYWGAFWQTAQHHYDRQDNYDATGEVAREFLAAHRAVCMERRGTWVNVKEDLPFCRCESTAVCDSASAQSWFYGPARAEADATARASVQQPPPAAAAAAAASDEADVSESGQRSDAAGSLSIACNTGGTTEVGKRVDCRLRVPGRVADVVSVDWQISPTDADGCQVTGLSEIGKTTYAFEARCAGDYRVQARAYAADDVLIGAAARDLHSDLVPPEAGLEGEGEAGEGGSQGLRWTVAGSILATAAALVVGSLLGGDRDDGPDTIVIEPR